MENLRMSASDFHFITDYIAYIDEFSYEREVTLVRAKNPDIQGFAIVQGNETRGYEFLVLNDRDEFDEFAHELKTNDFRISEIELGDDEKKLLKEKYVVGGAKSHSYTIGIDKERNIIYVEHKQSQNNIENSVEFV